MPCYDGRDRWSAAETKKELIQRISTNLETEINASIDKITQNTRARNDETTALLCWLLQKFIPDDSMDLIINGNTPAEDKQFARALKSWSEEHNKFDKERKGK